MQRQMLRSRIHQATVTACDPDYVDSSLASEADFEAPRNLIYEGSNR